MGIDFGFRRNTKHDPVRGYTYAPSWQNRQDTNVDPHDYAQRATGTQQAHDWASSWGVLGFHNYSPQRDDVKPDIRNYVFPSGQGRSWAGRQQLNGVAQLDPGYQVPRRVEYRDRNGKVVSGKAPLPYWQSSQAAANPPLYNRFGGQAGEVAGPIQTNAWHDALYAGVPSTGGPTGGPGTVSVVAGLRAKFGF